jgi:hypothetical protein
MNSNNNPTGGGSSAADTGGSAQSSATIVGTKKGFRTLLQQLLQGIETVVPDGSSLSTSSGMQAKAAVVTELTQVLSEYDKVEAQQVAIKTTRAQLKNASAANHQLYTELKDAVIAFFGRGSPLLAQFGIKARGKARPLTPEQKVLRAAKARATRAARHTMGSRQKAAVKSDGKLTLSVNTENAASPKPASAVTPTP